MALIKCKECGKEISDKATACIHCGCLIEINGKNNIKADKNKSVIYILMSIVIMIIIFLFILETTYDNFFISIIVSVLYFLLNMYLIKNFQKKDLLEKYFYILLLTIFFPLIIATIIMNSSIDWNWNNFSTAGGESYRLSLNIFGNCYYHYSNLDKDIDVSVSKCNYEKNGTKYTFYIIEEDSKKNSFDCELTNGKLKCPLRYTYPTKYIYLEKEY